ncbi:insecticidal toxin [Pseudomonas sp. Z003-0.4C(8344-21)]|uniref:TcdA/TcdB pore-forming domain-containing protein n=1 Tax=Pseudomonas sp. Z003-0.4C(8344-21) TaxID=1855380 RepID=UPI00087BB892|nr:TcdA/TcdB pore-forming domain-containing protein [Pseudomonas sp. Z003-0.4C(8344-21)]SDT55042.1 insecticidal toxin [Pseudomonas sp. Z003-0.4C(8344-21)]
MGVMEQYVGEADLISAEDYSALQRALKEFSATGEYAELAALYESAGRASDFTEKLQVVTLFLDNFERLAKRKTAPMPVAIDRIENGLRDYAARLAATVSIFSDVPAPVPKTMHFVWVGGSQVGAIQRDYMNVWRQVLATEGYQFNLWYDSDALLAFEMNRVISDSARVDAMESGGDTVSKPGELAKMIEDRARVLKHEMFTFLQQPQWQGKADQARIELMVRAYGKDRATLENFRQECLHSHQQMAGSDLQLRDVHREFSGHFLEDVYQREVAMRGNFAAASDVVRLQAEYLEGGRYSDMDYLPPLADKLGGVDISGYSEERRIGVLQVLLNNDETLMPGRDRHRYVDRVETIAAADREALQTFARNKHPPGEIFVAPQEHSVPRDAMRLGTAHGVSVAGEMNAHMLAHAGSGMTMAYMQMIRLNYDCLLQVERRAIAAGIDMNDAGRLIAVIQNVVNEVLAQKKFPSSTIHFAAGRLIEAIHSYYQDGIRVGARSTITLTGPGAAAAGLTKYIEEHLLPEQIDRIRNHLKLVEGYNVFTEEEMISGWTVNDDEAQWLAKEQEKWRSGKLKSRYTGQLADLLKPQQTLTFKQGWPVVGGKPVLLTSVLQQWMDDLGEPFVRAMREKLSGEITFTDAFAIGFDTRQLIAAQPQGELPVSHGAETSSNLNELFSRIAHDALPLQQLSPLVRVMLGGIFGADSLDDAGFAGVWQTVRELAVATDGDGTFARFDAIEKALHQRPEFATALTRGEAHEVLTARELKVQALFEALTVRQWSERIGQIKRTAQREYRTRIIQRSAQVREMFISAGATSARQLSQDLLMQGASDPGRRCYPLALLVGAAVAAGESAERTLVGHVATASISPEHTSSRALLSALNELRTLPTSAIGEARGLQSLDTLMQALEAKSTPAVLLLDTGDHALLLAKVQVGDRFVYRFYDPNFAIYAFAEGAQAKLGVERYLSAGDSALARLYGLGDMAGAQFNVVELNTDAIVTRKLSAGLPLDSFLHSPSSDSRRASVWARQALARQRSLSENARMGTSLAQVDARYWAQAFGEATQQLRSEHSLGREYLPLLDTLKPQADGAFSLTLVDAQNPRQARTVSTIDPRFNTLKEHLQRLVKAAKPAAPAESDGGSRLSFAFAIQTLVTEMRQRDYQAGDQLPTLSIALQVQVYVSYAQLGFGVVSDTVQVINLVRQVAASEQALLLRQSSLVGRVLGPAATGVGFAFSLVNIGFDIYNLSLAQNHEQRSRFSTSLAFNVAALGLDIAALAVGGTAGAAAAILSVPLLGIGIGATAIASNLGQIADKATAVGNHLRAIHNAYQPGAFTFADGTLQFPPEAVITQLDLQDRQVRFDSQRFYPWGGGPLELPQYNDDPKQIHRSLNIRQAFGLAESAPLDIRDDVALHTVVLPCTPLCYYGYEYQLGGAGYVYEALPGEQVEPRSASEHPDPNWLSYFNPLMVLGDTLRIQLDERIHTRYPQLRNSVADKLEYDERGNRRFYLHSTPSLKHILYKLHPVYKPTTIRVQLNEHVRQLAVPTLPVEWLHKISYEITSMPGHCQLRLTRGLSEVKFNGFGKWLVHAPWVNLEQVRFADAVIADDDGPRLYLAGRQLTIDGIVLSAFEGLIELAGGELYELDWQHNALRLVSVTLGDTHHSRDVLARLSKLGDEDRLAAGYLRLERFNVPFTPASQPLRTTAFYDGPRRRLLYARNLPGAVNDGLLLGAATADEAWFYHPDHATVWRVNVLSGLVVQRYRLLSLEPGTKISAFAQLADGTLRVSQQLVERKNLNVQTTLEFHLADKDVTLTDITLRSRGLENSPLKPEEGSRIVFFRHRQKQPRPYADETPGMAPAISTWRYAPYIHAQAYSFDQLLERAWIGAENGRYFRADPLSDADRVLLMPRSADPATARLFYSKQSQMLSHGIEPRDNVFMQQALARDVVDIRRVGDSYLATLSDGRLFEIDLGAREDNWLSEIDRDVLQFVGLSQRWLQQHPDWLAALPALARQYNSAAFAIIGLRAQAGQPFLAAWCVDEKLVLAQTPGIRELTLLGLTPDRQAVWLLDSDAGAIWRQTLVSFEEARAAFGNSSVVQHRQALPQAEPVWSSWTFGEVLPQGDGLLGRTREGVTLQLQDQQPARIVGTENRWSWRLGETPAQLCERLKQLLHGQAHAAFLPVENTGNRYQYYVPTLNRLFDVSAREDGRWATFLGTRDTDNPLLLDSIDELVFSAGTTDSVWLPGSHAERDAQVMTLQVSDDLTEVQPLLVDGVDTLILSFGSHTEGYRISADSWQRLDCIVVDVRRPSSSEASEPGLLALDVGECGHWLMSRVDDELLLADPDNGCSLIVRYAQEQSACELALSVSGRLCLVALEQWLLAFKAAQDSDGTATLAAVIEQLP